MRTDSTRSKGVQALKKHVYICHIKGFYKNYSVFTKQSTTANKLRYKGVSKLIMSPYVVNQGNTMFTYIFGNHFYDCTHTTRSFLVLWIYFSLVLSISLTFTVIRDPTTICFFSHFSLFCSFIIVSTGKLISDLGRFGVIVYCI